MKKHIKNVIAVILIFTTILSMSFSAYASIELPEKVRIGLFFTDPKSGINAAIPILTVSAAKGLKIGSNEEGKFTLLFVESSGNAVTIRKDSYFTDINGFLTEYSPDKVPPKTGEKIGPYHIKIGDTYKNQDSAKVQVEALRKKGVEAYPASTDTWQVWTGFFTDEASAQTYITKSLKPVLGNTALEVVQPSPERITIVNGIGKVELISGGKAGVISVQPKAENNPYAFTINGKNRYRGDLEVRRQQGSDMTVINILPLDQYLYGVVPSEMQASSHPEALKAQAVAARTYALYHLKKFSNLGFNLCNTTLCQVYKGLDNEDPRSNKAVDDTTGKKVVYKGSLAEIFFFSSSGGRTEDSKNVWGGDIPYLKSVEDKYESGNSSYYNWEVTLTTEQIKERMQQFGYDIGDILNVTVTKHSESGRVTELIVHGTKDSAVFARERARTAFKLYSQWFNITTDAEVVVRGSETKSSTTQLTGSKVMTANGIKTLSQGSGGRVMVIGADRIAKPMSGVPENYKFTGKGWGHAVGMSQEGAKGMANAGYTYDEILKHYFAGVEVE